MFPAKSPVTARQHFPALHNKETTTAEHISYNKKNIFTTDNRYGTAQ